MPIRPHRGLLPAALLLAGAALSLGCSGASRERLLVALFDDPPRPGQEEEAGEPAPKPSQSDLAAALAERSPRRAPIEGSIHGPYAARMCQACHAAIDENPDPGGGAARLRLAPQRLCLRCHEVRYLQDLGGSLEAVHGPVAGGRCLACHLPHRSREERMLRYAPADLCLRCHRQADLGPDHPEIDEMECMVCHDPHAPARAYVEIARVGR